MSDMLLDPVREACTFALGCADGCPCWAPADYEVFERGVGPSPACTDHANQRLSDVGPFDIMQMLAELDEIEGPKRQ